MKVDYSIRPAKSIERKMLAETLQRLWRLDRLDQYRYVGFGSAYFTDFTLLHKTLGINEMISIEKDIGDQKRYEFNRPFACISLAFGNSHEVLPLLEWDGKKSIVWLDYEDSLNKQKLDDIECVCTEAEPGSVLVVTVNASPGGA